MTKNLKSRLMSFAFASCIAAVTLCVPAAEATNVQTGFVKITQLQVVLGSNGINNVFIGLATAWPNVDGCTTSNYALMLDSATNYNLAMSMLYGAYANGDTVNFTINGCVSTATTNLPVITSFILQKS